tara:strand:- start:169 stop:522 length:354 start_codon:yes stop_codon:yes gene_type:complete
MGALDNIVFKNKKFSDILSEIYDNQKKKEKQITGLISELKPLISDIGDATLIVPLIKEYMEIGIRNDEQLIKMATIIQRTLNNSTSDDPLRISDTEKEELMKELENLNTNYEERKDG